MLKTLLIYNYIIGLSNLDLLRIQLQAVVQNTSILNLQIFVLQWESDIHQEPPMHHGQMV